MYASFYKEEKGYLLAFQEMIRLPLWQISFLTCLLFFFRKLVPNPLQCHILVYAYAIKTYFSHAFLCCNK